MRFLMPAMVVFLFASSAAADVAKAVQALRRADPQKVAWKHVRGVDLNCDGKRDEVFIAQDEKHFYVGVVLAPITAEAHYSVTPFLLEGDTQASFCGDFQSLTPESLPERIGDALSPELPLGYRPSKTCKGLRLRAGECDSFHLFWNHMSSSLDWWRL